MFGILHDIFLSFPLDLYKQSQSLNNPNHSLNFLNSSCFIEMYDCTYLKHSFSLSSMKDVSFDSFFEILEELRNYKRKLFLCLRQK